MSKEKPSKPNYPWTGKSVLVTGGCGFIGSHLVEALVAQEAHVWVLDNLQAGKTENVIGVRDSVNLVLGDVRDRDCVRNIVALSHPLYVFHLAANASVPGSVENPTYDFETNSAGTFALFDALRETHERARVILASSGAVYGQPGVFPITESHAVNPISPYGASKACAEMTARMFCAVYDVPVVVARIFNTYGPRMARFVVLDFLRKLHHNPDMLEILGDGKQKRDFTYIADTVQGLLLLAERGAVAEAYNLSSGYSTSVTEVAQMLISALGLEGRTQINYTGSSWRGDAQRWEVAIEKMVGLGYVPRVSLVKGLSNTMHWFQGTFDA